MATFYHGKENFPSGERKKMDFFLFREKSVSKKFLRKIFFFTKDSFDHFYVSSANLNDYQKQLPSHGLKKTS